MVLSILRLQIPARARPVLIERRYPPANLAGIGISQCALKNVVKVALNVWS